MLFSTDMRTMCLIMSSTGMAMMRCRGLLTGFVHGKHRSTMRTIGNLGWFNIDLYLLTGSLVLIIVYCIANVCG